MNQPFDDPVTNTAPKNRKHRNDAIIALARFDITIAILGYTQLIIKVFY